VTADELALQRLASVPRGIAKTLMLAYGFTDELISSLVLTALETVVHVVARIGQKTIEIDLVMITDAGRKPVRPSRAVRSGSRIDAGNIRLQKKGDTCLFCVPNASPVKLRGLKRQLRTQETF
jgi:hypothetical protein